jgi:hypothetical protein
MLQMPLLLACAPGESRRRDRLMPGEPAGEPCVQQSCSTARADTHAVVAACLCSSDSAALAASAAAAASAACLHQQWMNNANPEQHVQLAWDSMPEHETDSRSAASAGHNAIAACVHCDLKGGPALITTIPLLTALQALSPPMHPSLASVHLSLCQLPAPVPLRQQPPQWQGRHPPPW